MKIHSRSKSILIAVVMSASLASSSIAPTVAAEYPPNPSENGGGTSIENEDTNVLHYGILTKTKTISVNLRNKYEGKIARVDLKVFSKKNGKKVGRYITLDSVALDNRAYGLVKTLYKITEGQVIRVSVAGTPVVYVTVKVANSMAPGSKG